MMTAFALAEKTRKLAGRSRFSDAQIESVAAHGKQGIAEWVASAASERGVVLRRRPSDSFARAVSRLSDGVVDLGPVGETLVALQRAGVISAHQRGLLQVTYLR